MAIQGPRSTTNIIKKSISTRTLCWIIVIAALIILAELAWLLLRNPTRHTGSPTIIGADFPFGVDRQGNGDFPEYAALPKSAISESDAASARLLNAELAPMPAAISPASPFLFDSRFSSLDRLRARECLAAAVYYEAASESILGQRAVAQVVLNRVRHPAFPNSVCGVVFQGSTRATGCQFTFTCDGSLRRVPSSTGWRRALQIADSALSGATVPEVGTATHYHTDWVAPYWRTSLTKLATIGTHIFYTWPGRNGARGAFSMPYRGGEIDYRNSLAMAIPTLPPSSIIVDPLASASAPLPPSLAPKKMSAPVQADSADSRLSADDNRGTLTADTASGTLAR